MGKLIDKAKGKAKEIAGVTTNDRGLEAEGKVDQAKGSLKEGWDNLKHGVKKAVDGDKHRNVVHPDNDRDAPAARE